METDSPRNSIAGPAGAPPSGRLAFRAMRNGAALGAHEVRFARRGERLTVEIAAEYVLKLAFVTLFRYRLHGAEVWEGGLLQSARFSTDNNGARDFMRLQRGAEAFVLEGSRARAKTVPLDRRPATHWNAEQLKAPMVNPQDGGVLEYLVKRVGSSRVADARGERREANHYVLEGENGLELWYDDAGVWAGLRARAFDGSTITYLGEG